MLNSHEIKTLKVRLTQAALEGVVRFIQNSPAWQDGGMEVIYSGDETVIQIKVANKTGGPQFFQIKTSAPTT